LYMICLLQHFCCCVEFLINVILLLFLKILIKKIDTPTHITVVGERV
jgi:hypothetical protein